MNAYSIRWVLWAFLGAAVACGSEPPHGDGPGETRTPPDPTTPAATGQWALLSLGTDADLLSVWGSSRTNVFVGASNGTIYRYDGRAWTVSHPGNSNRDDDDYSRITGLWGVGDSQLIAVSTGMFVMRFDGVEWTSQAVTYANGFRFFGVWGSSRDDGWIVGSTGITHFHGSNGTLSSREWARGANAWTSEEQPLKSIWGSSHGDVWAVGEKAVVRFDSRQWAKVALPWLPTGDRYHAVWGADERNIWLASDLGVVRLGWGDWLERSWRASDHATVWQLSENIKYLPRVRAMAGSSPTNVIAVGLGGAVVQFDGDRWSTVDRVTQSDLNAVWVAPEGDVFAVGARGSVVRFTP